MSERGQSTTDALDVGGERALVARAVAGERSAYNRLVLAYQDRILALCMRLLGNREEAQEAAQDAFVRAYEHLGTFRGDAMFSTWIYQIASNACRNRRRSWWWRVRRRAVEVEQPEDPENETPRRELGDTRLTPDKDLERHRLGAALQKALAEIAPNHRELIVLRDIQDLPYDQIAQILGVELGTVKSRLARAREAMREKLGEVRP